MNDAFAYYISILIVEPVKIEKIVKVNKMPKKIMCAFGTDIDSVAGQIGSYAGGDSPSDFQRGFFATEVGVPRLLNFF